MNTLSILIIVELILLVVLCGVLMYLIFGRGQADVGINGDEFDLYKTKGGDNAELLKELDENFTYELKQAQKFKPGKNGNNSRYSRVYDPRELGGVAFKRFVKVFEADPTMSTTYTDILHNHVRTPETMFYDGATHYSKLSEGKPIFNSRILSNRSTAVSNTIPAINHDSTKQFTGFI